MIQTLKNESTTTNADNNVYMKYMSDFIIYLYTMDKLIELLNEYEGKELEHTIIDGEIKRRVKNFIDPDNPYEWSPVWWYKKSFGFIQWLVENEKIDLKKYVREVEKSGTYSKKYGNIKYMLLMLLSIQDNPIEFLISILK